MPEIGRPSQTNQRSRKGKKAWRKNIDLGEFEDDLETKRESETVLGAAPLFAVDTAGDESSLTQAMRNEPKLKSHQILNARSAVPGLSAVHKKKDHAKSKVKKLPVHDLLRASGRDGESSLKFSIERDGVAKAGSADPWSTSEPPTKSANRARTKSTTWKRVAPEAPMPEASAVELPDEGRSYNPSLESWKATIATEHARLEIIEREKVKAEEEQARIEAILNQSSDDEEEEEEEEEEVDSSGRISVNDPVKLKKKSKQKINKQRRHKERERLQARLRDLKKQLRDLHQLPEILESMQASKQAKEETEKKPKTLKKAHSKHPVMEEPFAIKLSEELDDSLRRIKPEGNLAKDRFRSLQARGIIEARVRLTKKDKRKARKKITEKWAYKDIPLRKQ